MFDLFTVVVLVLLAFTWGYIAAVKHAAILDQRDADRRLKMMAPPNPEDRVDYSDIEAPSILRYN